MLALHIKTKKDPNGNSRSAFAVFGNNGDLMFVLEDYTNNGVSGLGLEGLVGREAVEEMPVHEIKVAPSEYKRWLKKGES